MEENQTDYCPNWVFYGDPPPLTYAEKVALYQRDQALRFSSRSRADYERRKAEIIAAELKEKAPDGA